MTTKRGRAAQLDSEIEEALKRKRSRGTGSRRLTINHRRIPPDDLRIAKFNASRDPDGQAFPWLPRYPLGGGTVYYDGKLWTVYSHDGHGPSALVHLQGQGHDDSATVPRDQLRPITWTQRDEDQLHR